MNAIVTQLPMVQNDARAILAPVVLHGDTSQLTQAQKMDYLMGVCRTVGVNPMTQPFQFVRLQGKEVLYATRTCTDQLRTIHGISLDIVSEEIKGGLILVRVRATNAQGRTDSDIGAVPVTYPKTYRDRSGQTKPHPRAGQMMEGEDYSNALLKAVTKAKRRVTLSLCGLGWLDETEVASVQQAEADLLPPSNAAAKINTGKTVRTFELKGWPDPFPYTGRGFLQALDAIESEGESFPTLVLNNLEFLDKAAEALPEQASRIADIRARAAEALTPPGEDEVPDDFLPGGPTATPVTYDPETGEVIEALDAIAQKVAERRGAAPRDTPTEDSLPR